MSDLSTTIALDFDQYFHNKSFRIYELVSPLSDDQIWARPFPYGNSIGHLLLHLIGNLNFYIGRQIASTGYERDRPLEFTDESRRGKDKLLFGFMETMKMVKQCLYQQSTSEWTASYAAKGMERAMDRFSAFLNCAGHLDLHTGQIIYLCKELERQAASASGTS